MPPFKNLKDQKFGRLKVLKFVGTSNANRSIWKCICDCGNISFVHTSHLTSGHTMSCGCYQRERIKETLTKHGMSHTVEWAAYRNARMRCTNKKTNCWKHYGGRGIKFKFPNFQAFLAELGKKPISSQKLTVDRIDVNGHYEKGNLRWATYYQQQQNTRKRARL
jgi:hypothetical protein